MKRLINKPKLIGFADVPTFLEDEAEAMIWQTASKTEAAASPKLIHLCGIPASGKSTYAQQFLLDNTNFALVQFDSIMANLVGYKRDCATSGLVNAFQVWELPARAIGYHLLQALLENKRNVLFDHTASFRNHLDLIDKVKEWGNVVEMHYLDCPPAVALERVRAREAAIQRHTPEHYIWDRCQLLEELIPLYRLKVDVFLTVSGWNSRVKVEDRAQNVSQNTHYDKAGPWQN
jgi:predicted kinase